MHYSMTTLAKPTSTLPVLEAPKPSRPEAPRRGAPGGPSWSGWRSSGGRIPYGVNDEEFCCSDIYDICPRFANGDVPASLLSTVVLGVHHHHSFSTPSAPSPALSLADAWTGNSEPRRWQPSDTARTSHRAGTEIRETSALTIQRRDGQ